MSGPTVVVLLAGIAYVGLLVGFLLGLWIARLTAVSEVRHEADRAKRARAAAVSAGADRVAERIDRRDEERMAAAIAEHDALLGRQCDETGGNPEVTSYVHKIDKGGR